MRKTEVLPKTIVFGRTNKAALCCIFLYYLPCLYFFSLFAAIRNEHTLRVPHSAIGLLSTKYCHAVEAQWNLPLCKRYDQSNIQHTVGLRLQYSLALCMSYSGWAETTRFHAIVPYSVITGCHPQLNAVSVAAAAAAAAARQAIVTLS